MQTIGVLGSGAMGAGIAQVAAMAGHEVWLYDNNPEALQKASAALAETIQKLLSKQKLNALQADHLAQSIHFTDKIAELSPAALVIEAVVEKLEVKKSLFAQLEALVGDDCLLATNTSSLSVTAIAAACKHPERVLGLHFFNPPPLMQLVEVVPAVQTDTKVLTEAEALMRQWGKWPVVAKDTPGFIVNRIARPFYGEAIRMLEENLADAATIDWAMTTFGGFKMGPFELMDYIGHDVNYVVTETVFQSFFYDPRYKPSFTQKRLLEAGFLGRKAGRGFYDYRADAVRPQATEDQQLGRAIFYRILAMLINEAADALYMGVATREDIETAMTKGVNYPKGLLQWADEWGIEQCVGQLDALYDEYREDRYRCSPWLRKQLRLRGN